MFQCWEVLRAYESDKRILDIDRASSCNGVKKAYKKLALAFHPDKQRHTSEAQLEAIHLKFQNIREAFDVLSDEELRAVYDRVRDYMEVHGNKTIPTLSPEEASLMRSGMGELSRLRRQGLKTKKHTTRFVEVLISLGKLNAGCIKTKTVIRRRIDDYGHAFSCPKSFHLIIRKGSASGTQITFENEGEETVDTHPGDLVFTLRQKPDLHFKCIGVKDLELRCPAAEKYQVWYLTEISTIYNRKHLVQFSPIEESLKISGNGGVYVMELSNEGLHDPEDPWENPREKSYIQVRFRPILDPEIPLLSLVCYSPMFAVGCYTDGIGGAAAGITVANILKQRRKNVVDGETKKSFSAVCMYINEKTSVAANSVLDALCYADPILKTSSLELKTKHEELLLDDEFLALSKADVIVLDLNKQTIVSNEESDIAVQGQPHAKEQDLRDQLHDAGKVVSYTKAMNEITPGLWNLLVERRLTGSIFVALGTSCSVLGLQQGHSLSFMPYIVRSGGGKTGWRDLYTAVLEHNKEEVEGVGVMKESTLLINGVSFEAEELVAPTKDMISQTRLANLELGYQPSYQYGENIESKGFSEHCNKICLLD
eukprot:g5611.t1